MEFNTANIGLCQDVDFLVNTNTTSYPLADKARNMNRYLDEVVNLIFQSDGTWQWVDTNDTDSPRGEKSFTITSGTQYVEITGATYLKINRVEVKDINGNYQQLAPIDQSELKGVALTEFLKTEGMPKYYDMRGDSLFMYPTPNSSSVTCTSGLKVYAQKGAHYFESGDTTVSPGFAPIYHRYLSYGAALDYAIANEMNGKINLIQPKLDRMKQDIITFYSTRQPDSITRMTTAQEDYGSNQGSRSSATSLNYNDFYGK